MAKLYFRYGAVGSAKTLNLLAVAHNYRQQEKKVLIVKPGLDNRFGTNQVRSRAGLEQEADVVLHGGESIDETRLDGIDCLLVDEVQFFEPAVIEHLRHISTEFGIPVICYGLRTDYRRGLFPGSQRLLELADSIEEVKTTCAFCNRKAIYNLKIVNGAAVGPDDKGPVVDLGCEEKYLPACAACYATQVSAPLMLSSFTGAQAP
jgi:thymidine kinase